MEISDETITETVSRPCGCPCIGGDAPWLMPRSIGCGRTQKCNMPWKFALRERELDNGDLPGKPPHTIVCVRARGKANASIIEELMTGENVQDREACNSYDLYLCVYIPVEIIVRDSFGCLHRLSSAMSQIVRVPLCSKARSVRDAQIYIKARVCLRKTARVYYPNDGSHNTDGTPADPPGTGEGDLMHRPTASYDNRGTADDTTDDMFEYGCDRESVPPDDRLDPGTGSLADTDDDIARNVACALLGYTPATGDPDTGTSDRAGFGAAWRDPDADGIYDNVCSALPPLRLDVLIEACLMKLVPYGIS